MINNNEVKKELYRTKAPAIFSHYAANGSTSYLYYTVEVLESKFQFRIATTQLSKGELKLSDDLGQTAFSHIMKASELNRWIAKSIESGDFIELKENK